MMMFLSTLAAIYSMLLLIFAFIAKDIKNHGTLFSGKIINQKDPGRFSASDMTIAESNSTVVRNVISIIGSIIQIIVTIIKMILMSILAALFITFLFSS